MQFARQQRNEQSIGKKDSDLGEVESKDSPAAKTSSPLSKKASRNVDHAKKPQHVPREPQEGQLVNYEHDSMPKLPEASKGEVQEDLMKAPKAFDAPKAFGAPKAFQAPNVFEAFDASTLRGST